MSSRTSTSAPAPVADTGFRPWHLYALLSMVAATAAVILSRQTHPAALLVLSAAVMAAGLVGLMVHRALSAFTGTTAEVPSALGDRTREAMLRDKALVLRSIKELEFDRATGKVGDADFKDMNARLRAKAVSLMEALERAPEPKGTPGPRARVALACPTCRTVNDDDAKFCKQCGGRLA
jgi:hypothetical protein